MRGKLASSFLARARHTFAYMIKSYEPYSQYVPIIMATVQSLQLVALCIIMVLLVVQNRQNKKLEAKLDRLIG